MGMGGWGGGAGGGGGGGGVGFEELISTTWSDLSFLKRTPLRENKKARGVGGFRGRWRIFKKTVLKKGSRGNVLLGNE